MIGPLTSGSLVFLAIPRLSERHRSSHRFVINVIKFHIAETFEQLVEPVIRLHEIRCGGLDFVSTERSIQDPA